jgi:hypothetical protein
MMIHAKSIAITALLALAAGLSMPALAQNSNLPSANGTVTSVAGTTWTGTDSDGDYYEYTFLPGGVLQYKAPLGTFTHGTWKQDGDSIYFETNQKYSEYQGNISGTHMGGRAWNVNGRNWTWAADKK